MEEAFLKIIRVEPDHATHRLVHADWLEERGSRKSQAVRQWNEAAKGISPESVSALEALTGNFDQTVSSLPADLLPKLCCCLHLNRVGAGVEEESAWAI